MALVGTLIVVTILRSPARPLDRGAPARKAQREAKAAAKAAADAELPTLVAA